MQIIMESCKVGILSDFGFQDAIHHHHRCLPTSLQEVIITVKYFSWDHKSDLGHIQANKLS